MPCGCQGSEPTRQARQVITRQQAAGAVPGGPGEAGYTWDGPKKVQARPRPVSGSTQKRSR